MLRRVLMVEESHTLRVMEICYVDIRLTIGHSHLSIRGVFPNGSSSQPIQWFLLCPKCPATLES